MSPRPDAFDAMRHFIGGMGKSGLMKSLDSGLDAVSADTYRDFNAGTEYAQTVNTHIGHGICARDGLSFVSLDCEVVRERLHVLDDSSAVRVGSEALSALWRLTPTQGWLARLSVSPFIRPLFRWSYNGFAAALYRWNRWSGR